LAFLGPVRLWPFLALTDRVDYASLQRPGTFLHWAALILLGALAVTLLQQRVLQTWIKPVGRWSWTNIIGWCTGWAVGLAVAHFLPGSDVVKGAAGGATGGLLLGLVTGDALVPLLMISGSNRDP
jgi:hypothetical protein